MPLDGIENKLSVKLVDLNKNICRTTFFLFAMPCKSVAEGFFI